MGRVFDWVNIDEYFKSVCRGGRVHPGARFAFAYTPPAGLPPTTSTVQTLSIKNNYNLQQSSYLLSQKPCRSCCAAVHHGTCLVERTYSDLVLNILEKESFQNMNTGSITKFLCYRKNTHLEGLTVFHVLRWLHQNQCQI